MTVFSLKTLRVGCLLSAALLAAPAFAAAPKAAPAPQPAMEEAAPKPKPEPSATVKIGELSISNLRLAQKDGNIDIYLSIKNLGGADERLSGADSKWKSAGLVLMRKDRNENILEQPITQPLIAGKETVFKDGDVWLRLKSAAEVKDDDVVPVTLYFRRSPNAVLNIALNSKLAEEAALASGNPDAIKRHNRSLWQRFLDWFRQ